MCVSKMTDFYQNMEDSNPILSTWVHVEMLVLQCLKEIHFAQGDVCK